MAHAQPGDPTSDDVRSGHHEASSRRRLTVSLSLTFGAGLMLAVWTSVRIGGPWITEALDDVAQLVAALGATAVCAWRWRHPGPARRFFGLMGLSAAAWGLGEAVWCWYELVIGRAVPFPSFADAGFLMSVPLAVLALLSFPMRPLGARLRVRAVVDGSLVASALLFVSWATVLGPIFNTHQGNLIKQILALAYPAGDVIIGCVLLSVATRATSSGRLVLGLIGSGIAAMAVADSVFAYATEVNHYGIGNVADTGWFVGYLLIVVGALCRETAAPIEEREGASTKLGALVAYVPAVVALAIVFVRRAMGRPLGALLQWDELCLVALLGTRQLLTLLENLDLSRKLAAKVEARDEELRLQNARFAALVRGSSDLTTIVSDTGVIEYQSPASTVLLGRAPEDAVGTRLVKLVHRDDRAKWFGAFHRILEDGHDDIVLEIRLLSAGGESVPVEVRVANFLDDEGVVGVVLNSRDITERRCLEEQLNHQAFHDPLSGLANRALFTDRLSHALARRERISGDLAVMVLDLDDFKTINDGWGHGAGDELLRAVGKRLVDTVRTGDTVARLGGDEFAILVEGADAGTGPVATANRILDAFRLPFRVEGNDVLIDTSIGIATSRAGMEASGELLRHADVALYAAKGAGKHRWEQFQRGMDDQLISRLQLESQLRRAVDRQEFVVYYQPIVDTETTDIVGLEALMRWDHPERGVVPPSEFIPAAEATGLIVPMGAWLLRQACGDVRRLQEEAELPELGISVNLSARQLDDPALLHLVREALSDAALKPEHLTLEITESLVMADPTNSARMLRELRGLGVQIAVDDFGTGYSSLGYLHQLPVTELKIDRSFVEKLCDESGETAALVRTIVELASQLHLVTVGEGVETPAEHEALSASGCRLAQGYLFGRPAGLDALRRWLAESVRRDGMLRSSA